MSAVVHTTRYSLYLSEEFSHLGELRESTVETFFYPFQRGFFIKLEQEPDAHILNKLYTGVTGEHKKQCGQGRCTRHNR